MNFGEINPNTTEMHRVGGLRMAKDPNTWASASIDGLPTKCPNMNQVFYSNTQQMLDRTQSPAGTGKGF